MRNLLNIYLLLTSSIHITNAIPAGPNHHPITPRQSPTFQPGLCKLKVYQIYEHSTAKFKNDMAHRVILDLKDNSSKTIAHHDFLFYPDSTDLTDPVTEKWKNEGAPSEGTYFMDLDWKTPLPNEILIREGRVPNWVDEPVDFREEGLPNTFYFEYEGRNIAVWNQLTTKDGSAGGRLPNGIVYIHGSHEKNKVRQGHDAFCYIDKGDDWRENYQEVIEDGGEVDNHNSTAYCMFWCSINFDPVELPTPNPKGEINPFL